MNKGTLLWAGLALSAPALAEDFDGSRALVCAPTEVMECGPGEACTRGTPRALGAPTFIRVDFAKKTMIGPKNTSSFKHVEKSGEQLVVQGVDLGMGWTFVLDRATGDVTITLADRFGAFTFFGSCTPQ